MKVIAINGSPRPRGNTVQLLEKALEGARKAGADTELISLYPLQYRGCVSCFYCKRKDKEHGTCIIRDDLSPVLEKIKKADAVIFGSPIYFYNMSSGMHALLERLFFSQYIYSEEIPSVLGKTMPSAFIYSMNVTEELSYQFNLHDNLKPFEMFAQTIFAKEPIKYYAYNTVQFDDYSKYESSVFSESAKRDYKKLHYNDDLQKAENIGTQLVT